MNAWGTSERIHLESRIIRQRKPSARPRDRDGFDFRVLLKRLAPLRGNLNRSDPVERQRQNTHLSQELRDLAKFSLIVRGNDQRNFMKGAQVCQGYLPALSRSASSLRWMAISS